MFLLYRYLYQRRFQNIVALLLTVFGVCLPIFIQGNNFPYHYAPLLLPTAIVIYLGTIHIQQHWSDISVRVFRIATTVFVIFAIMSTTWIAPVFFGGIYSASVIDGSPISHADRVDEQQEVYSIIEQRSDFNTENTVLYLASGQPAYYLESQSYSRYYFPLPLTARLDNPEIIHTEPYRRIHENIINYSGRYIVHEPSFVSLSAHPNIQRKIETEYCLVFSSRELPVSLETSVVVYERRLDQDMECQER